MFEEVEMQLREEREKEGLNEQVNFKMKNQWNLIVQF